MFIVYIVIPRLSSKSVDTQLDQVLFIKWEVCAEQLWKYFHAFSSVANGCNWNSDPNPTRNQVDQVASRTWQMETLLQLHAAPVWPSFQTGRDANADARKATIKKWN